ncbi:MAG: hypothetical protein DKT66_23210 [Candidatus Melainabacteria bacterium]|nr:MAG: hypothetical protein DKT66_23210 [Candidatus Melainabacteria bacterium]
MGWEQTLVRGKIVNAIIRVQRGTLDIEQFIQDVPAMWLTGLTMGIFNDSIDFKRLLQENNFPAERMEEIDDALLYGD